MDKEYIEEITITNAATNFPGIDVSVVRDYMTGRTPSGCNYGELKRITNADLIRAMSDEELAEFFEMIPHLGNPPTYTIDGFCIDDGLRTKRQWLDWLRQEANG